MTTCYTCHQQINQNKTGVWLDKALSVACDSASGLHTPEYENGADEILDGLTVPEGTVMFVVAVVQSGGTYNMIGSIVDGAISHPNAISILRFIADQWEREHHTQVAQTN